MTERQLERERVRVARQRRRIVRGATVAGLAIALVTGWVLLSNSAMFAIKSVEVRGVTMLTEAEVRAAVDLPAGATLLRVSEKDIRARVLRLAWVERVEIQRRWPGTLRVVVTERQPVVAVDLAGEYWFVGADASQIATAPVGMTLKVPVVRDLPDFTPEPGKRSGSPVLNNALKVLAGISRDIGAQVSVVSAPSIEETALHTAGNVEIMIGEAVRLQEKSTIAEGILAEQGDQVVFIDVRSVEHPISRGLGQ